MINLDKMLSATDNVRDIFDELDNMSMVLSVMGTAFDEYCAERGMTSEETEEAFKQLMEVQAQIHKTMGPAQYIVNKDSYDPDEEYRQYLRNYSRQEGEDPDEGKKNRAYWGIYG